MTSETPWLDWALDERRYACKITEGNLPIGANFNLERDINFSLHAKVHASLLALDGVNAIPHVIHAAGCTETGAKVMIQRAFIRNRVGTNDDSFTFHLEPQEVVIKYSTATPTRLIEWLANFDSHLLFPGSTSTSTASVISRKRSNKAWNSAVDINTYSTRLDHLNLHCKVGERDVSFLLGRAEAPSQLALKPGFIEYLDQGFGLPTEEDRNLIRAAISFIFDRQLVLLGETYCDVSNKLAEARAVVGAYHGPRRLLRNPAEVPAPLHNESNVSFLCEKRASDLLQCFVQHNAQFRIARVAQKMWDARTSTLDSRIARIVATIEFLRDIYLEEGDSLLPKKDWAKLCTAMKATLIAAAKEHGITDERAIKHLGNKLPNINFGSSTKQFDRFFEALKLTISETEQKAMDMRNHQAHGIIYEREYYPELALNVRRVQILLNRVVLTLIGHQGTYNDYTHSPSLELSLSEPSGSSFRTHPIEPGPTMA